VTPAVILGLLALALLAAGSRLRAAVVAGAGLVGLALAEAVVILGLHGSARALAAVPAAALLLAAGEISFGLADGIRPGGTGDRRRQAGWVGGCAAGAAAAAFVVLGADAVALGGGDRRRGGPRRARRVAVGRRRARAGRRGLTAPRASREPWSAHFHRLGPR
jgi:hypothetical protein